MVHLVVPFVQGLEQPLYVVKEEPSAPFWEQRIVAAEVGALPCLVRMVFSSLLYAEEVYPVPLFAEEQYRTPSAWMVQMGFFALGADQALSVVQVVYSSAPSSEQQMMAVEFPALPHLVRMASSFRLCVEEARLALLYAEEQCRTPVVLEGNLSALEVDQALSLGRELCPFLPFAPGTPSTHVSERQ